MEISGAAGIVTGGASGIGEASARALAFTQIPSDEQDLLLVVSPFISFKGSDRRYLALQ